MKCMSKRRCYTKVFKEPIKKDTTKNETENTIIGYFVCVKCNKLIPKYKNGWVNAFLISRNICTECARAGFKIGETIL